MAIKQHLQEALDKITAEKTVALATAQATITQEKIVPYNLSVDQVTEAAIGALEQKKKESIRALEENFAEESKKIRERAEANKKANAKEVIDKETALLVEKYDKIIGTVTSQIATLGD